MKRLLVAIALIALMGLVPAGRAAADDKDKEDKLQAKPFVFVGKAGDCGTGYPAGSQIVTAAWLGGMGLPDNGGQNVGTNPQDNPNKQDPHLGLLLSKNGTTPDCSSSGARITNVKGMTVRAGFELGFDYRNGGHCGAGAPRFNVVSRDANGNETFHFVGGCANGVQTPAPQDPAQWTTARFGAAQQFPAIPTGSKIVSISILYDEGTDTANNDTQGVGLAVIDNIFIGGTYIRRGQGIQPGGNGKDGDRDGEDD